MSPKLYITSSSPPCRAVRMVAKHIDLELELKVIKPMEGENRKPEYLRINPQHTVPTLDDNGFTVWDSHAIIPYLVEKYGKDDSLYPNDIEQKALINQRLHFDNGVLFTRFITVGRPMIREGKPITDEGRNQLGEAFDFLEAFLQKGNYMVGNSLTLADFSIVATVSSIDVLFPVDAKKWPKFAAWFQAMKKLPAYEANVEGLKYFMDMVQKTKV